MSDQFTKRHWVLLEILQKHSKENPIVGIDLCSRMNMSRRALKAHITVLREAGYPVVSKETDGGGYWMATTCSEVRDFQIMIYNRMNGYQKTLTTMRNIIHSDDSGLKNDV